MQFAIDKEKLRAEIKKNDACLSEKEKKAQDAAIVDNLFGLALEAYKKVFVYVSCQKEVGTYEIINRFLKESFEVYVPLCHEKGEMEARRISSLSVLSPGRYNIPEPPASAKSCQPSELSLIVVPGLCFGEDLTRLGRGAGYYDRFLEKAKNSLFVGLCREANIRKTVPHGEKDKSVDIIVTEKRVITSDEMRGI